MPLSQQEQKGPIGRRLPVRSKSLAGLPGRSLHWKNSIRLSPLSQKRRVQPGRSPPPATSTSNERSNREAIASPPPTGKAKPSVDQSASSRAAARGRVYERLGKMRRAPRSPLRLAFEQCLAETLGEGHKFDRRLLDAARPVLTAEPPLIEVGRSRAQDPTKKWSARPKPGAPAGVTRVIAELRETESGRAFLDRFLPHLEKLSPRSDEAVEVMVAESVMSRRENVTPVTLSEPRPVEPGEDGDAVQRAWAERQKKTR